jgi:hypothetical protein
VKAFIKNDDIELRAEEVISLYERKRDLTVKPPVPIEEIVMQVYGLYLDWDELEEKSGVTILGGLSPGKKTIVLNIAHKLLFDSTQGLERSTVGHEAGHWEYHIDKTAIAQPTLFDHEPRALYLRSVSKKYGAISVFRGNVLTTEHKAAPAPNERLLDSPEQRRVVNRFAAALSMPRYLVKEVIKQNDFSSWPGLYRIRDIFDVSISALTVRLQQLGYIYLDGKVIHRDKAEALGQGTLGI